MAVIKPFKGYRFKLDDNAAAFGQLCAPPYDMIDDAMVDRLYALHPNNVVRITQNKREASDAANMDRHVRAAAFLNDWINNGVIARDAEDSVYVYSQKFTVDQSGTPASFERIGICALVKLVDFEEQVVFPHEYTLSGPKQDRYELMEATNSNTGQIFGLATDDDGVLYAQIREIMNTSGDPVGAFTDESGVVHTLYRCVDAARISHAAELMKTRSILIADGHHRYETALRFYRDRNDEAFSHVMMTLVSMADPGLIIRPFHRLIRKSGQGRTVDDMKSELSKYFDMEPLGQVSAQRVDDELSRHPDTEIVFWDCASDELFGLRLNVVGADFLSKSMPERSDIWKCLDVSKINCVIINGILELPLDGHVLHDIVHYVNDVNAGAERLRGRGGKYYGGFFIKPVSISVVNDIVSGGERMPQKSTNFFPKLYSGLVFNKML